jgi:hypothetical protein
VSLQDFADGTGHAVAEGVGGGVVAAVMVVLVASPVVTDDMKWMFGLLTALPLLALFRDMLAWSIIYTGGWYFGLYLINGSGIIPPLDLAFYIGAPAAIWIIRGYLYFHDNS